ncbi:unnamed protein product [Agarophyton chilense]
MFRLAHLTRARVGIDALHAVVRAAAADPLLERRSSRVWSVWRYVRSQQLCPTPRFVFTSFRVCAEALDVESAAALMHFALVNRMFHTTAAAAPDAPDAPDPMHLLDLSDPLDPSDPLDAPDLLSSPSQLHYYNHIMHAACLLSNYHLLHTAHREMLGCSIAPDHFTHNILLTTALDQRRHPEATLLLDAMHAANRPLAPCTFAAIIRAAALQNHPDSITSTYNQYLTQLHSQNLPLTRCISPQAVAQLSGPVHNPTVRACAAARADPTLAAFHAYRACAAAHPALALLRRLTHSHRIQPSYLLYSLVMDTCWKAGQMHLADHLRSTIHWTVRDKKR